MITPDLLQFAVLAFAIGGLAAVAWEIATRDPRGFWDMLNDVRRFARQPLPRAGERAGKELAGKEPAGKPAQDSDRPTRRDLAA